MATCIAGPSATLVLTLWGEYYFHRSLLSRRKDFGYLCHLNFRNYRKCKYISISPKICLVHQRWKIFLFICSCDRVYQVEHEPTRKHNLESHLPVKRNRPPPWQKSLDVSIHYNVKNLGKIYKSNIQVTYEVNGNLRCLPELWISPNSWAACRTTHGSRGKLGRLNHFLVVRIILTYL